MSARRPPSLDTRSTKDFELEILGRARSWIPEWALTDDAQDFGLALLRVAARFDSEVAERLDKAGEKMRRGLLDWLSVRGEAARPARMPVVFKMVDKAPRPVVARAPVRLQVDAQDTTVVFETEDDVQVVPGGLAMLVATDADADAIYLGIPGVTQIEPLPPLPTQWRLKSFAAGGTKKLQVDPEVGLAEDMIVAIEGLQYRIGKVEKDIITIDPPLPAGAGLDVSTVVDKVSAFTPYASGVRNRQNHALYLGHLDLLNVESAATIDVVGGELLGPDARWAYWGKDGDKDELDWQTLDRDTAQPRDAVRLLKKKGAVEPRPLGQVKSARWIGAFVPTLPSGAKVTAIDQLFLRINPGALPQCPIAANAPAGPAAIAMANNTPAVLSGTFLPLGRMPRQFDAFYLGSPEAFSKPGADVQLCIELADPSFAALTAIADGAYAGRVFAGIGKDRALHFYVFDPAQRTIARFPNREPLQPPLPPFQGQAIASPVVALDKQPTWRMPTWGTGSGYMLAMSAGSHVWAWQEVEPPNQAQSGWVDFGVIPGSSTKLLDGLVYLGPGAGNAILVALQDGKLYRREVIAGAIWSEFAATGVKFKSIAAVLHPDAGNRLISSRDDGLVAITEGGDLYAIVGDTYADLNIAGLAPDVAPIAFASGDAIALDATKKQFVAVDAALTVTQQPVSASPTAAAKGGLEAALDGVDPACIVTVQDGAASYVATWTPPAATDFFTYPIPGTMGRAAGTPTIIDGQLVVPGDHADLLTAEFALGLRLSLQAPFASGVLLAKTVPALIPGDVVTMEVGMTLEDKRVSTNGVTHGDQAFYELNSSFTPDPVTRAQNIYRYASAAGAEGQVDSTSAGTLILKAGDHTVTDGATLWIEADGAVAEYAVSIGAMTPNGQVDVTPNIATSPGVHPAFYWLPIPQSSRVAPYFKPGGTWDAGLLDRAPLRIANATPTSQFGRAFAVDSSNHPTLVVLDTDWQAAPDPLVPGDYSIDASAGTWSRRSDQTASNPELSWEYWNGAWSKLVVDIDETLNLKSTGAVRFKIPPDIQETDWSGKTSFWIRARLVGGDYGTEQVTVQTHTDPATGDTLQTIKRSIDGIKPPVIVSLAISYAITNNVLPTYVLAEDSGSTRDQSDANRTPGAIVEAFVPLAVALGRAQDGSGGATSDTSSDCPPACGCPGATSASPRSAPASGAAQALAVTPASGRALFLGFDARLSGSSVNVLFVVGGEGDHEAFAPLACDAIVGDRFVPLAARDGTRALGETGVLTLAFADPPTQAELFGRTLVWLRCAPHAGVAAQAAGWQPSLAGVYLNGAWVSATETLTRELLGSSEGAPDLALKLARPPVLRDTLVLRVREPLSNEDRALLGKDKDSVIVDPDLPGDWVLWRKVDDTADYGPSDRVYSLDEETGWVRFGDGLHGMIPPIGRDSIVAFAYRRTEPPPAGAIDVPSNAIDARTQLNLVTPVEGVEAVFSADHAAGGAPPETADRVVRFGNARLRHRGRAVSARDFEDLALESSPDIVQARMVARGSARRLVVVMRGADPMPDLAQQRELRRLLLSAAPPAIADRGAFEVGGPALVAMRIELTLRVDRLDHAGAVGEDVSRTLLAFFDTASGGVGGDGWPLGLRPREEDIAFAIDGTAHLVSIERIALYRIGDDGSAQPWPAAFRPYDLACLRDNGIRLSYQSAEAFA